MAVEVLDAGFLTTVQDLGRFGYTHLGISPAGAADPLSLRIANRLVGNDANAPALEMTLMGAALRFNEATVVAIAGAKCEVSIGGGSGPLHAALPVPAGAILSCGNITAGARTYIAMQGGIEVALVMGSASTDLRGGFGGQQGRKLQAGDVLQIGRRQTASVARLKPEALDALHCSGPVRLTRGAQQSWFGEETFERLFTVPYVVSEQSDRAGLRLKGEPLQPRIRRQLLTDGIPLGAIQVPPDGQPIILFVDLQSTGGYPKIANVISTDLHRIGQLRPRDAVRFQEVSLAEALNALRQQEEWFSGAFE